MSRKRVVILGSNVAGFAAATALKEQVASRHDVTVISRVDQFVFPPSLTRIPLGARLAPQAVFSLRDRFAARGIAFRHEGALRLDLPRRRVVTPTTEERYDFLVIATGAKPNYGAVPGLGPRGYTQSILTLAEAEQARSRLEAFVKSPGPVVIGDVQGSTLRGRAYEFLLNLALALEQRGLSAVAPLTHLTSGPALGSGRFEVIANATVAEIVPNQIHLTDGRKLPFAYSVLAPSFLGVDVVRACEAITNAAGFVQVNAFHHTEAYPEIFAAGAAVADGPIEQSGELAERAALQVARNIVARINGEPMPADPPLPVDVRAALQPERAIASDAGWLVPGADATWARLAFERYFAAALQPV